MRPSALLYMYMRRLRVHGVQELLAGVGIAIAVALVFAAVLSQSSISSSASRIVHTVVGPASLQVRARSAEGFAEEPLLGRIERMPGVVRAAPVLEQAAAIVAPSGRSVRVQLAGADLRLAVLDGLGETLPVGTFSPQGIALSQATAQALGLPGVPRSSAHLPGGPQPSGAATPRVTLKLRGAAYTLPVSTVLGPRQAGALSEATVAVMSLTHMQRLGGLQKDVTRVLVQTRAGSQAGVRANLERVAGGGLEVAGASQDTVLLSQALGPSKLASGLFAAIGALLGLLLAFNAMLLTVSDRRRTIADLRMAGARRVTVAQMVLFEALALGIPASLLGLATGYALSTSVFHQSTGYLAQAFTLSEATVVGTRAALLSLAGGVLATCLASAVPLLDVRRGRARDAIYHDSGAPGHSLDGRLRARMAVGALCLLAGASALWLALPSAAIPATALLALATVLAVPWAFAAVLAAAAAIAERAQRLAILPLALASLRATTVRSLALAATGAVALFGSVALGGSRANLLSGIRSFAHSYVADADVWVTNPGDNQAVDTFAPGRAVAQIRKVPGVAGVQPFYGGFVQLGGRRVWLVARAPQAQRHVTNTQIRNGQPATALARMRAGGWVMVSEQIASERRLGIGGRLVLPSPTGPRVFRIAATTTNLAWPGGVVFMSAADYRRGWKPAGPTALGVTLRPGADPRAARAAIARALGRSSGLEVSLAANRAARIDGLASEGLGQLRQIAAMLLVAAVVAMVAALGSNIWQRRPGLAGLRLFGASTLSLQGILLIEAMLMLTAGCLTGALAGVYGQVVIDGFLRHVTGFPLASPAAAARPLEVFAGVLAAALCAGAVAGWFACRVRPVLALASE